MAASPKQPDRARASDDDAPSAVHTHTPRPDELSREAFEFIAAVDLYKRRQLRSFLTDEEILTVLHELGYRCVQGARDAAPSAKELSEFAAIRARYRREKGRLFPTWSELFELLKGLGYVRTGSSDRAA
jgi:hypothetical protein